MAEGLPAFAACIAIHTREDVQGMSMCVTPAGASASRMAFIMVGGEPVTPASPTPFAPSGLVGDGTQLSYTSRLRIKPACGM
jgi:hypothetical protein